MKTKKRVFFTVLIAALLIPIVALSACTNNEADNGEGYEDSEDGDTSENDDDSNGEQQTGEFEFTGMYVGMIDSTMFELTTNAQQSMQFKMEELQQFIEENSVENGDVIKVTYEKEGEMNNVTDISIESRTSYTVEVKQQKGKFIEVTGSGSIEAEIGGLPVTFYISNAADFIESKGIEAGDQIIVKWYMNRTEQNKIIRLDKYSVSGEQSTG